MATRPELTEILVKNNTSMDTDIVRRNIAKKRYGVIVSTCVVLAQYAHAEEDWSCREDFLRNPAFITLLNVIIQIMYSFSIGKFQVYRLAELIRQKN